MVAVARPFILRWTFGASCLLHAGVIVFFLARLTSSDSMPVPIGVEMLYVSPRAESTTVVLPAKRPVRRHEKVAPAPVEKTPSAEIAAPRAEPSAPVAPIPATAQASEQAVTLAPMGSANGRTLTPLERYGFALRGFLLSRLIYPQSAKRLGFREKVVIDFKVAADGSLKDVKLSSPSSKEIFNRAAVELIRQAERFEPLPSEARLSVLNVTFPIEYIP